MAGDKRAPTRNDVELARIRGRGRALDGLYKVLRTATVAGSIVACIYFVARASIAYAGKDTSFLSVVQWVADLGMDRWTAYALAGICGGGWFFERKSRRRTISGVGEYVKSLEQRIDPGRSSSNLTSTGVPQREDLDDA